MVTRASHLVVDMNSAGAVPGSGGVPTYYNPYHIFSGTLEYAHGVDSAFSPEITMEAAIAPPGLLGPDPVKKALTSLFYGAPMSATKKGFPAVKLMGRYGGIGVIPSLRGFKYGFINTQPTHPRSYYRRDRYGQFRDMMEQTPETATKGLVAEVSAVGGVFSVPGLIDDWEFTDGPVHTVFFSRTGEPHVDPLDTNSQNLSPFQTSSMPYIDGHNVDRDVVNHPPPDMTDKTTISEAVDVIVDE